MHEYPLAPAGKASASSLAGPRSDPGRTNLLSYPAKDDILTQGQPVAARTTYRLGKDKVANRMTFVGVFVCVRVFLFILLLLFCCCFHVCFFLSLLV